MTDTSISISGTDLDALAGYLPDDQVGDQRLAAADIPDVVAALTDEDPDVRETALEVFGTVLQSDPELVESSDAARTLVDALERGEGLESVARAVEQLSVSHANAALARDGLPDRLVAVLANGPPTARRAALPALGIAALNQQSLSADGAAAMVDALDDPDPEVRVAALGSVATVAMAAPDLLADTPVVESFVARLDDANTEVRSHAVDGLGTVRTQSPELLSSAHLDTMLPRLVAILDSPELPTDLRAETVSLCQEIEWEFPGTLGDTTALAALVACLDADEESVRKAAAETIGTAGKQLSADDASVNPVPALVATLDDDSKMVRREAMKAFAGIAEGDPALFAETAAPDVVVDVLDTPLSRHALSTLAEMACTAPDLLVGTGYVPALLATLDDPAASNHHALSALVDIGEDAPVLLARTDAVPDLVRLAHEQEEGLVAYALDHSTRADPAMVVDDLSDDDLNLLVDLLATDDEYLQQGAVTVLTGVLETDGTGPRRRAEIVRELGRVGADHPALLAEAHTVEQLQSARDDDSERVREAATDTLDDLREHSPTLFE